MTIMIGIDPGDTGAVARIGGCCSRGPGDQNVKLFDMTESPRDLAAELQGILSSAGICSHHRDNNVYAIVEQQGTRPGQAAQAVLKTGKNYGIVIGCLAALAIPYVEVSPVKWKRHFGLIGKDKEASRALASALYPEADLRLKKHHGRAEAILLARYGLERATPQSGTVQRDEVEVA